MNRLRNQKNIWGKILRVLLLNNYFMLKLIKILSFLIAFILVLQSSFLFSQNTNDDCLMCHSDKSLTKVNKGQVVSLFVDKNTLTQVA